MLYQSPEKLIENGARTLKGKVIMSIVQFLLFPGFGSSVFTEPSQILLIQV